jgi:hypothetical protein
MEEEKSLYVYLFVPDGAEWEDIRVYRDRDEAIKAMLMYTLNGVGKSVQHYAHVEEYHHHPLMTDSELKHSKSYVMIDGFNGWLQTTATLQKKDVSELVETMKANPLSMQDAYVMTKY